MSENSAVLVFPNCAYCHEVQSVARQLATCQRCTRLFCSSCASSISPQFCKECLVEVEVTDKTFTKTEVEYDVVRDEIVEFHRGCRKITFAGADWVFYSEAIHKMTDEQLEAAIQFHRACVSQMENEMTQHKVDKVQASIKIGGQNYTSSGVVTTSKVKVTRVTKAPDITKLAGVLSKEQKAQLLAFLQQK